MKKNIPKIREWEGNEKSIPKIGAIYIYIIYLFSRGKVFFGSQFWDIGLSYRTVISVNMPPPHFYRKYAPPFSEGSFLKILW